ncbi:MAG: LPS assembly lipoprotein LptE [Chthoniobacterales bacterium]
MISSLRTLTLLALLSLGLTACGYHLGASRPTPMRSIKSIAVPTFKNSSYEPRLGVLMANATINQIQMDGTYQIVSSEHADAILYCTVKDTDRRSIRSVISNVLATSEYELILDVNFEVVDRVTGALLMQGEERGRTTFFPTGDLQTDERQAVSVAATNLGKQITSRISEGW